MGLGTWGGSESGSPRSAGGSGSEIGSPGLREGRQELYESPEGVYTVPRIYTGAFARTVAAGSGDVTITGIPFKPYMLFCLASGTTEIAAGGASVGFAFDPSLSLNIAAMYRLTGTGVYWAAANSPVLIFESVGNGWTGALSSMTSDGFVWTHTANGTPTIGYDVDFVAYGRG